MNREVHVRFCERFRGEIPLYLLDFIMITFNETNTTENQIKELIKEIEKVESFYLDKKGVLIKLREIIKNKKL